MADNKKIQKQKVIVATFYQSKTGAKPVLDWLKSKVLSDADRQVIGSDMQMVEYGWPVGRPLVGSMKGGLWEVRSTLPSKRETRVFFGVEKGRMVLVHAIIKKTQATPDDELDLARERWADWKKANP